MVRLKLDGKPFIARPLPPALVKMIHFLENAPQDEVFSTEGMLARAKVGYSSSIRFRSYPEMAQYKHGGKGHPMYWGHPKAIQKLKEELGGGE